MNELELLIVYLEMSGVHLPVRPAVPGGTAFWF